MSSNVQKTLNVIKLFHIIGSGVTKKWNLEWNQV